MEEPHRRRCGRIWESRNMLYKAIVASVLSLVVLSGVVRMAQTETSTTSPSNEPEVLVLLSQSATANAVAIPPEPARTHGVEHVYVEETTAIKTTTAPETTAPKESTYYWNVPLSKSLQDYIRKLCKQYGIPMELVLAIIKHESNFNPNEISPSRDYGLMQIHDGSFGYLEKQFGVLDYLNPKDNIKCGIYILWLHIQRADGDLLKGVMAYNKGDAGMRALWESGVRSTHYTERVFYYYELYLEQRLASE